MLRAASPSESMGGPPDMGVYDTIDLQLRNSATVVEDARSAPRGYQNP